MNLEEIRNLTDEALDIKIASDVMGYKVFDKWANLPGDDENWHVVDNRNSMSALNVWCNFCVDSNHTERAERTVIVQHGFIAFRLALQKVLDLEPIGLSDLLLRTLWFATPRQRAEASLLAIQKGEN